MHRKNRLVEFSVNRPKLVIFLAVILTLGFLTQFPKMRPDTNPKHMLPDSSAVRVWNDEVDKTFSLYEDMIVLGIVNDGGILNPGTLDKVKSLTDGILGIKGVAARDVTSFTTIDNVTVDNKTLRVNPLMSDVPKDPAALAGLKDALFGNPLFINRIISRDGKTTAIYIPLEKGANGKEAADAIRELVKKAGGPEKYYVAGDPVARDTFGSEMFKLMGLFSPIAGAIMFVVIYLMFRNLALAVSMMAVAVVSIIWSMGLFIGLGFPIHIMSSMAPVFLMAIATDSIHIFNEFYFKYSELRDKKKAVIETMREVGRPVKYTALATAVAFGVLIFMQIIPVRVFGAMVAFGTVALRLLSFSLIPAILTLIREESIERAIERETTAHESVSSRALGALGAFGTRAARPTVIAGLVLFAIALVGTARITVNNNMVEWFKKGSDVRVADRVMNGALGGTSLAYVVATGKEDDYIKTPEAMNYIEGLQRHLEKLPFVGKTSSVVDYVRRINLVLHDNDPAFDRVPETKEMVGQYLFLFGMSAKPSDLDNVVDYPFRRANIWVQLKTWDVQAMRSVIASVKEYEKAHPSPMELKPAGIAYFNLVWNDEVLWDMLKGFLVAMVIVFVILALNFRSVKWAIIGYIPLLFTILLIYGVVGFAGKDFDMPMAVLSCLSLGMAVDFSIHFISRFKQRLEAAKGEGDGRARVAEALLWTAARPGKGIMRNAALFASAFSVMLFAPLTPYVTVGAFIVSMMMLSAITTIIYLPALITLMYGWLFKGEDA